MVDKDENNTTGETNNTSTALRKPLTSIVDLNRVIEDGEGDGEDHHKTVADPMKRVNTDRGGNRVIKVDQRAASLTV